MTMITVTRYHDISCGHRVYGHEGKCVGLHGHNYRIHFTCAAQATTYGGLDDIGRVVDFGVIKETLCAWLEENWDHKMLLWERDPALEMLRRIPPTVSSLGYSETHAQITTSLVALNFNPTAENMALYLLEDLGPILLAGRGVRLTAVRIEETMKCSAEASNGMRA